MAGAKFFGFVETILCADTYDLDCVDMLLSELLNIGSFPITYWSVRSPEPQQQGFLARAQLTERHFGPRGYIEYIHDR